MNDSAALFRLLGDPVRLRILRLLSRERLNVSEMTGILGLAQSGVSRHLRLLKESGLLREDRDGGWSYYRVEPSLFTANQQRAWPLLQDQLLNMSGYEDDEARLGEVLRQRREEFREETGSQKMLNPGRSWSAWARALSLLMPSLTVADLGCGEGYLTLEVARWARKVWAVDQSRVALEKARSLAKKKGASNIHCRKGKLEKLPLKDRSVDLALLSQVLHCVQDPEQVLQEAFRILSPGGSVLILDLRSHREEWVKERFGDVWLGFEDHRLCSILRKSGFSDVRSEVGAQRRGDPFTILIAFGRRKK